MHRQPVVDEEVVLVVVVVVGVEVVEDGEAVVGVEVVEDKVEVVEEDVRVEVEAVELIPKKVLEKRQMLPPQTSPKLLQLQILLPLLTRMLHPLPKAVQAAVVLVVVAAAKIVAETITKAATRTRETIATTKTRNLPNHSFRQKNVRDKKTNGNKPNRPRPREKGWNKNKRHWQKPKLLLPRDEKNSMQKSKRPMNISKPWPMRRLCTKRIGQYLIQTP